MTIKVPLRVRQKWIEELTERYSNTTPSRVQWTDIIETLIDDVSDYAEDEEDRCCY